MSSWKKSMILKRDRKGGRGKKKKNTSKRRTTPSLTLKIPFISDQLNRQIKQILAKHDIPARLVNPRGKTISDLATKHLEKQTHTCHSKSCFAPGLCHHSNVVHLATCTICGDEYIGMTQRRLHDRAREHVHSAKQKNNHTALGEHYRDHHPSESPSISFKIIKHEQDLLRLHIEEAMAIRKSNPALNRRRETLGTGFLPWSTHIRLQLPTYAPAAILTPLNHLSFPSHPFLSPHLSLSILSSLTL